MFIVLCIFSIIGISCGLIVHSECPQSIRESSTVNNSFILMIVSLVFVVMFTVIYFTWNILHTHREITSRKSSKMY